MMRSKQLTTLVFFAVATLTPVWVSADDAGASREHVMRTVSALASEGKFDEAIVTASEIGGCAAVEHDRSDAAVMQANYRYLADVGVAYRRTGAAEQAAACVAASAVFAITGRAVAAVAHEAARLLETADRATIVALVGSDIFAQKANYWTSRGGALSGMGAQLGDRASRLDELPRIRAELRRSALSSAFDKFPTAEAAGELLKLGVPREQLRQRVFGAASVAPFVASSFEQARDHMFHASGPLRPCPDGIDLHKAEDCGVRELLVHPLANTAETRAPAAITASTEGFQLVSVVNNTRGGAERHAHRFVLFTEGSKISVFALPGSRCVTSTGSSLCGAASTGVRRVTPTTIRGVSDEEGSISGDYYNQAVRFVCANDAGGPLCIVDTCSEQGEAGSARWLPRCGFPELYLDEDDRVVVANQRGLEAKSWANAARLLSGSLRDVAGRLEQVRDAVYKSYRL